LPQQSRQDGRSYVVKERRARLLSREGKRDITDIGDGQRDVADIDRLFVRAASLGDMHLNA
jgi:hypothetical protein